MNYSREGIVGEREIGRDGEQEYIKVFFGGWDDACSLKTKYDLCPIYDFFLCFDS